MKRTAKINRECSVLVALAIVIFASSSLAADFFPLDVWEEMTAWERNHAVPHHPNVEDYSEPMPVDMNKVEMAHTNFPFDVLKELNDLGGVDWGVFKAHPPKNSATTVYAPNPYWMPDGLMSAAYNMDTEN